MLINLKNGSTISIPSEKYFDMSDEDIEKLELYYRGAEISDPFFASVLYNKQEKDKDKVEEEPDVDELDIPSEDLLSGEEEE